MQTNIKQKSMGIRVRFKEGWLILALVLAMALSPAIAMRWADWVPGLWVLQTISIIAVISGLLLAKSNFPGGFALLLSLIYGLFTVGFFSGTLLPPELTWQEKIPQMVSRQAIWFSKAANVLLDPDAADISRDGLIFIMHTGVIMWLIGYAASWYTFRRLRIWPVILPSALLLMVTIVNYYGSEPLRTLLLLFVFIMLLYIVGTHYMIRERNWLQTRVIYSRETRFDFFQTGILIALLVIPIAWLVPNISATGALSKYTAPVDSTWQRVQDGWTQLFASLKSYGGEYSDPFGNTLALGGPRQIEPIPIMDVDLETGRYLRGITYDNYTGSGWASTDMEQLIVLPDEPLDIPNYSGRQPITATITTFLENSGLIYAPHQPVRTDRQAKYLVRDVPNGEYDVVSTLSRYVLYEGQTYKSWGSISRMLDDSLRLAGNNYPNWIRERYLQLPTNLSPRVIELAAAITNGHDTPYDKADSLTQWLRENITYNELVQAPPPGTDPLEYLLFESKEGYCNYYASALAVMLRSQGVPARIVAGYTRGSWDESLEVYRVYSDNAHAWVEVFFPNFGWVEFEPTVSEAEIIRTAATGQGAGEGQNLDRDRNLPEEGPETFDEGNTGDSNNDDLAGMEQENSSSIGLIIGGATLFGALLVGAYFMLMDRRNLGAISVVAQVYERMNRFAEWIGIQLRPSQTPYERAEILSSATPEGSASIEVIANLYVEERFGQTREGTFDERAAVAWQELRPTLIRQSIIHRLSRYQKGKVRNRNQANK